MSYPPGCTQRELDYYAGGYDEPLEPCGICGDPFCTDPHEDEEPDMPSGDLIRLTGLALFGERWQSALAHALDVNRRTVRRWMSGEDVPRPGVWHEIHELARNRRADLSELIPKLKARL